MTKIRPPGFEPPYPAWSPTIPDDVCYVMAQVAIQRADGKPDDTLFEALKSSLMSSDGVRHVERLGHVDRAGAYNDIAVCYWTSSDAMDAWLADSGPFGKFASGTAGKDCGLWYEAICSPRSHYEINGSTPDMDWGLSMDFGSEIEPFHAYWGSMRDRIEAAEDGGLSGRIGPLEPRAHRDDERVTLELPEHLCLIRTVQGKTGASAEEVESYENKMKTKYELGVDYLAMNPVDSRCISARLVRYDNPGLGRPNTETIAWFASLEDLETWVHDHPTHKAIFVTSQAHAARFAPDMKLLLGHEVVVAPAGGARAAYVHCHPQTGLAPFI